MIHPVVINPIINPVVRITDPVRWRAGKLAPDGAILHFDADIDAFAEQTGGPHTFNHAVLSPQYQRNGDGSYTNVGAKPAVDVFDGEKWLRSCGAVTNLLPSGAEGFTSTAWDEENSTKQINGFKSNATTNVHGLRILTPDQSGGTGIFSIDAKADGYSVLQLFCGLYQTVPQGAFANFDLAGGVVSLSIGVTASISVIGGGWFRCSISFTDNAADANTHVYVVAVPSPNSTRAISFLGETDKGLLLRNPQLTATSYPVPYVPPGVTQPASNATTTNGMWFALPDGSPLWHALDGGPDTDGVELVTNGDFSDGLTGWYQTAVDQWSVYDGAVKSSGTLSYLHQTSGLLALGVKVRVSFTVKDPGTVGSLNLSLDNGGPTKSWLYSTFTAGDRITFLGINTVNNTFYFYPSGGWNGSIDNISVQRIQPQPLTLATRVRMGVGSGDLALDSNCNIIESRAIGLGEQYARKSSGDIKTVVHSYDGANQALFIADWPRNSIIRRVTQVSADGTQFRVGYMIEGTDTAIQWGSWVNYDSSFNPSTLYRLMLGYNNPYPMWFNKITAWKKQVTDAEILEAMA